MPVNSQWQAHNTKAAEQHKKRASDVIVCRSGSALSVVIDPAVVLFQNIIKKVSGQKFVYKFVSQPDPSLPDGVRSTEEGQRRDPADPNSQLKGLGGVASTCPPKGLPQVHVTLFLL